MSKYPTCSFNIKGSFKITGRGLVICGNIVEGRIFINNYITFCIAQKEIKLKIKGFDFVDNIKEKTTKIGLTFYEVNENIEDLIIP